MRSFLKDFEWNGVFRVEVFSIVDIVWNFEPECEILGKSGGLLFYAFWDESEFSFNLE